jgi:hypothetical protein
VSDIPAGDGKNDNFFTVKGLLSRPLHPTAPILTFAPKNLRKFKTEEIGESISCKELREKVSLRLFNWDRELNVNKNKRLVVHKNTRTIRAWDIRG